MSRFYENYGAKLNSVNQTSNDTIHMGTIDADLLQGKVLIIDYSNQQFAICKTVPGAYHFTFSSIELDKIGRVLVHCN